MSSQSMVIIADRLGYNESSASYRELYVRLSNIFNDLFWNASSQEPSYGFHDTSAQACNALALAAGVADNNITRQSLAQNALINNVVRYQYHLTTGSVGTKWLLSMLSESG